MTEVVRDILTSIVLYGLTLVFISAAIAALYLIYTAFWDDIKNRRAKRTKEATTDD